MFLALMEYAFLAVFLIIVGTQMVWPLWKGRPMFPIFGPRRQAEARLGETLEELEAKQVQARERALRNKPERSK